MTLGQEAARRVDDEAAAERVVVVADELVRLAGLGEAECVVQEELIGGDCVGEERQLAFRKARSRRALRGQEEVGTDAQQSWSSMTWTWSTVMPALL